MKQDVQQYGMKREKGQIRWDKVVWPALTRGRIIFRHESRARRNGGAFGQSPAQRAYNQKLRAAGEWRGKTKNKRGSAI